MPLRMNFLGLWGNKDEGPGQIKPCEMEDQDDSWAFQEVTNLNRSPIMHTHVNSFFTEDEDTNDQFFLAKDNEILGKQGNANNGNLLGNRKKADVNVNIGNGQSSENCGNDEGKSSNSMVNLKPINVRMADASTSPSNFNVEPAVNLRAHSEAVPGLAPLGPAVSKLTLEELLNCYKSCDRCSKKLALAADESFVSSASTVASSPPTHQSPTSPTTATITTSTPRSTTNTTAAFCPSEFNTSPLMSVENIDPGRNKHRLATKTRMRAGAGKPVQTKASKAGTTKFNEKSLGRSLECSDSILNGYPRRSKRLMSAGNTTIL